MQPTASDVPSGEKAGAQDNAHSGDGLPHQRFSNVAMSIWETPS
ncbi:MAG TPA: hypothetical protein VHJ58_21955 [Vicinamibacterales bacterium]|nr:hypothetical protein [Vicinamibacterales bacterium]